MIPHQWNNSTGQTIAHNHKKTEIPFMVFVILGHDKKKRCNFFLNLFLFFLWGVSEELIFMSLHSSG